MREPLTSRLGYCSTARSYSFPAGWAEQCARLASRPSIISMTDTLQPRAARYSWSVSAHHAAADDAATVPHLLLTGLPCIGRRSRCRCRRCGVRRCVRPALMTASKPASFSCSAVCGSDPHAHTRRCRQRGSGPVWRAWRISSLRGGNQAMFSWPPRVVFFQTGSRRGRAAPPHGRLPDR